MKKLLSFTLALLMIFGSAVVAAPQKSEKTDSAFIASAADYKPAKVKNVKAVAGITTVKLSWSKVKNATKYYIYKYDSSSKKYVYIQKTGSTEFKVTGLKMKTEYKFTVRAVRTYNKKDYKGSYSDVVTVKTKTNKLKPTAKDYENLGNMLDCAEIGKKFDSSNKSYKTAGKFLFRYGPTDGQMWMKLYLQFGNKWPQVYGGYQGKNDPKNLFGEFGYYKIKASVIDFMFKNVFGVKSTHEAIKDSSFGTLAYYYKGYYYIANFEGGDMPPKISVINSNKVSGKYQIKIKIDYSSPFSYYVKTATASAKLYKVDGKRVWRLYSFKVVKNN